MRSSGLGGRLRPPIYDIEGALLSAKAMGVLPQSWLRKVKEELASGEFVNVRSGELSLWIYVGPRGDHVLITAKDPEGRGVDVPIYCSCQGFQMRLTSDEGPPGCTHVYALMEFLRSGRRATIIDETALALAGQEAKGAAGSQGLVTSIVSEVLASGRSQTLREILRRLRSSAREL